MSSPYESEQRQLSAGLAALAAEDRGLSAPPRLEARLIAVLPRRRRVLDWRVAAPLAAALLIGVWAVTHAPVQTVPPRLSPRVPPHVALSSQAGSPAEPVIRPVAREFAPDAPRPRLRRVHAASSRRTSPAELAVNTGTPFFPLPLSEPLGASESGEVWRVRLPRSTMASFGLPVSAARLNDMIEADVIVGQDGSPRAIRFLP